jgi:predicted DNA-binding WGR domain protein
MTNTQAHPIYLEHRAGPGRPRFYAARLQSAGNRWLVVRHWGFFGRPGWHAARVFATAADAERELARLLRRREREGYSVASHRGEPGPSRQLAISLDGPPSVD